MLVHLLNLFDQFQKKIFEGWKKETSFFLLD